MMSGTSIKQVRFPPTGHMTSGGQEPMKWGTRHLLRTGSLISLLYITSNRPARGAFHFTPLHYFLCPWMLPQLLPFSFSLLSSLLSTNEPPYVIFPPPSSFPCFSSFGSLCLGNCGPFVWWQLWSKGQLHSGDSARTCREWSTDSSMEHSMQMRSTGVLSLPSFAERSLASELWWDWATSCCFISL